MTKEPFKFKQFSVDQTGCAMKINTDGVLLGAITEAENPAAILDIGTGTGVIGLMLAQKFITAKIDAVEIDTNAAQTAYRNFKASTFADRLSAYPFSFETYFDKFQEKKYDLIVSNPPFHIRSLKSPGAKKALAKHTDVDFFEKLIKCVADNLSPTGNCLLILPVTLTDLIIEFGANHSLYPQKVINVHSYNHSEAHRVIICFGFNKVLVQIIKFVIYKSVEVYSEEYQKLLRPYLLAF